MVPLDDGDVSAAEFLTPWRSANSRLQTRAQVGQTHRKLAVAIHTGIGASDQIFLDQTVVLGDNIEINGVTARQGAKLRGCPLIRLASSF